MQNTTQTRARRVVKVAFWKGWTWQGVKGSVMSAPILSVVNNNFHPELSRSQCAKIKKIIDGLSFAGDELANINESLKSLNSVLVGRGGVRLVELTTAQEFIRAYAFILTETLSQNGVRLGIECGSCKGRGWFPCGSVANGRSKCEKCGGHGVTL